MTSQSSSLKSEEIHSDRLHQQAVRLSQSFPSSLENDTQTTTTSLSDLQKEYDQASLTHSNQSLIHHIDSLSLDDHEVFDSEESNFSNRKISLSESDLLASLHRNTTTKPSLDNPIEHDDILFIEWDKERCLFQDYINSLRKEIRVLLQERLEYQTQIHTEYKYFNDEQTKIDLLQKSLEEKNFVLEQLQTEYELMKDKNKNLIRRVSDLQSDTKTQVNLIEELKQTIADLTVDMQNHVIVKRRLEISINNLESDIKILDTERIRLTSDVKENQHNKQDSEKLLQKANVQIAEQGSTIEMLRSENVQVRSQLSTIQRRMFQEKQQIMDYLRQIENDLIEKEQIKQRELSLRQEFDQLQLTNKQDRKEIEQLKNSINQDRQKIEELQQQCSQLANTIHTQDEDKTQLGLELDSYKSATKRLYSQFEISFDSIQSIDQLIPILEDRFHTKQSTPEVNNDQDLDSLTAQCKQLDEANRAWQLHHRNQLIVLHDRFKLSNNADDDLSFDDIVQQIENRFNDLQNQANIERADELQEKIAVLTTRCTQLDEANRAWQLFQQAQLENFRNKLQNSLPIDDHLSFDQIAELIIDQLNNRSTDINQEHDSHSQPSFDKKQTPSEDEQILNHTSVQSSSPLIDEELQQLRDNLAILTDQCAQLEQANSAWQQFQLTQLEQFRNKLRDYFSLDENVSFDQAAQVIIDQMTKEREDFNTINNDLRSDSVTNLETIKESYINTINELTLELMAMKEQVENRADDVDQEQLTDSSKQTPDEIPNENHQLQENVITDQSYQQTPVEILRNQFEDCFSIDYNVSFEDIVRLIVEQITREREDFNHRYQVLQKTNNDLRSESANNMESIRQSYLNTVDELNQELLAMKEQYEQLDDEKQFLNNELENRSIVIESSSPDSNLIDQPTDESPLGSNLAAAASSSSSLNKVSHEELISSINNLTAETDLLKSREITLAKDLEDVNEKLIDVYNQCEQLQEYNKQLLLDRQTFNRNENDDDKIKEDYSLLQNQYMQLDNANRAWQQFDDNQIDWLRTKLNDYIQFDENFNFEQILQTIVTEFEEQNQLKEKMQAEATKNNVDLLEKQLFASQQTDQIITLQEEIKTVKQQLKDDPYSIDLLKSNLQLATNENEHLEKQYNEVQEKNDLLINDNHHLTNRLNDLEKQSNTLNSQQQNVLSLSTDTSKQSTKERTLLTPTQETQIHTINPVQSSNTESESDKIRQFQTNLVLLTTQCEKRNEANHAWQQFHQNQLELFRTKLQDWILLDINSSLEQMAQQIVIHFNQLGQDRNSFLQNHNQLDSTSNIDSLQKQLVNYQYNESFLAENLEQLNQKLLDVYKQCEEFQEHNAQLILSKQQVDKQSEEQENLIKEYELLINNSKQRNHTLQIRVNDLEQHVNSSEQKIPVENLDREEELNQLRTDLNTASTRCLQLDEANRPWQQFQQVQLENFRNKLQHILPIDDHFSFDQIAELILEHLNQVQHQHDHSIQQLQTSGKPDTEREGQSYINTINDLNQQILILNNRSTDINQEHDSHSQPSFDKKQTPSEDEQILNHTSVQSSSPLIDEELQQLRDNLAILTDQCAQLEQATSAWQQFQLTQLEQFRNKLRDYFSLDENVSFDQAAQVIIDQMTKEREDFNTINNDLRSDSVTNLETIKESYINTINELTLELMAMKEQVENRANDVDQEQLTDSSKQTSDEIPIDDHQLRENVITDQSYQQTPVEILRNQLEDCFSIDYNVSFEDIVRQIVEQVTKERENFNHRYQILEKSCDDLRSESANIMKSVRESYLENIKELNQELFAIKEECKQYDRLNKQLLSEKESLDNQFNDRSIVVGHQSSLDLNLIHQQSPVELTYESPLQSTFINKPETTDNYIQYEPLEHSHVATGTIPLTSESHQTQMDPIDMIDQSIQTESFHQLWSMSDDEDPSHSDEDNDRFNEYLDEICSLSSTDLSNRLNNECEQILSKQNFKKTSFSNLDLNQLILLVFSSLSNQHLTDEAKQLYNETLIRALKQEYELINNEKNDLNEQFNLFQEKNQQKLNELQLKYNQLLEKIECERAKHLKEKNDEQYERDYNQLRREFDEIVKENELLKDYNSQMYQEQFQEKTDNDPIEIKSSHDVNIQCDLTDELRLSKPEELNLNENNAQRPTQEQEIHRLKTIIEEIQLENENLKDLNSEIYSKQISLKSEAQTDEANDWNDQISPLQFNLSEHTIKETIENETQTDDQSQDKPSQTNNKLKRSLQTIKDKIQRVVIERPDLFPDSSDDTIDRLDHLISAIESQATQINLLTSQPVISTPSLSEKELIEEKSKHNEEMNNLKSQLIERDNLLERNKQTGDQESIVSSSPPIDQQTQTDDQSQDKLVQINNKLKRALQTIKEKIHRVVNERPDLVSDSNDDTIECLDHLISAIANQTTQIETLEKERGDKTEQQLSVVSSLEDHQKQIDELQQALSQKDEERTLLRERLNEVELQLRQTLDDHASTTNKYQSLVDERETLHSAESEREMEQLREEIVQLKQSAVTQQIDNPLEDDLNSLRQAMEQQSEELRDISEKYLALLSQLESQAELDRQRKETELRINDYENQIENIMKEHANLMEDLQKNISVPVETTDNESQTDNHQHEKLVQMNNKLKRLLQTFKEKIHRFANERPDLFDGIGEETSERLEHLISTVENQASQIDVVQAERDQAEDQFRSEIKQLQDSLEAQRYQLENERPVKTEQLLTASPPCEDISSPVIEDYQKQVDQLRQALSQQDEERTLLREHLNEVELQLRQTLDDHASTRSKYESLAQQQTIHLTESQREMEQLRAELTKLKQLAILRDVEVQTDEDIKALHEMMEEQSEQLKDLKEKNLTLISQFEMNIERKESEAQLNDYKNQIENLMEEIQKKTSSPVETTDNESQTDGHQHEKLVQMSNKLKRALQTLKEKIHRVVSERPDLFDGIGDDTNDRLDHLISTVENQATEINVLQAGRNQAEEEFQHKIDKLESSLEACQRKLDNELRVKTEELLSAAPEDISPPIIEDYEKQIDEVRQALSQKDEERTLFRERLNEVELELRKALDDHASTMSKYQSLVEEREILHSAESQREIEQLQEELIELRKLPVTQHADAQTDEDVKSLYELIEQQSEQLRELHEKHLALESRAEFDTQKYVEETEVRINDDENQIENIIKERAHLLEVLQKNTSSSVETIDNESQTDNQHQEKLVQINNKLKRALQTFKEKIHRVVSERPDLFDGIGEETSERLDHLISTVKNQAIQIDVVQAERDQAGEELRREINELQSSLEACQYELDNERRVKTQQLVSAVPSSPPPEDNNASIIEEYQKQINQLKQTLSQKDDERSLLREHLNQVEVESRKTLDDHASSLTKYESLVQERDTIVEQQVLHSAESQREIEQLKNDHNQIQEELSKLKQSTDSKHAEIQTDDDINMLHELIQQQTDQLKDLNEKCLALSSQVESHAELQTELDKHRKETEIRINDYENRIENIIKERAHLLEVLQKNTSSSVETIDNESQTDNQQQEKLVQMNKKLKRALQTFKEKIHRVVNERPDLFDSIGEDTSERLDRLISTIENQAIQIDVMQAERDQAEEQSQSEIRELQSSREAYRDQLENERSINTEQLLTASSASEDISSLGERLNEVELQLRQTLDDHALTTSKYESLIQERDELVEQQTVRSAESQRVIEELNEMIEQQSAQLKDLTEKNLTLSSQVEMDTERKESEVQLNDYKNQIENLMEEIQKNTSSPVETADNESQTNDHQQEKLVQENNKLKRSLQTFREKIDRVVNERPDLFDGISEETNDRLDHLISTVENQASYIDVLKAEERSQHEINNLQSSFDVYPQPIDTKYRPKLVECVSSSSPITDEIATQTIDFPVVEEQDIDIRENETSQEIESDDNDSNDWFDASPDLTDKEVPNHRDIDIQCELLVDNHQPTQELSLTTVNQEPIVSNSLFSLSENVASPSEDLLPQIKDKIEKLILESPTLFPNSTDNTLEDLDQIIFIIKNLQDDIKDLQSSFDTYRNEIENERLIKMEQCISNKPMDVSTQTLGFSMAEEYRKQIEKLQENELSYQNDIERLIEEKDQAQELLAQWKEEETKKIKDYEIQIRERDEQLQQQENHSSRSLCSLQSQTSLDSDSVTQSRLSEYQCQIDELLRERALLMEQLSSQSTKENIEVQTTNDMDLLPSSTDQGVSRRHMSEQEMLAWSQESEQLKHFVKQIQIENKKLKDIILKFERMIFDYMRDNERLKQENQHLSLINYSSVQKPNQTQYSTSMDKDVCYLTLKWLTYEVAQRTSNNNNEQSLLITNDSEQDFRLQLNDNERQLKNLRVQNERLKKQLETYTIQFKHVRHEMKTHIQEMSALKDETERLRKNEIQYRLEVDRLKADLEDDQLKIQQLERELSDIKVKQSNKDTKAIDNLRDLLELKERELNALKEKLDYTKQTHQLELQEATKSNQFSLDNVKRYQQTDLRHQEKRRELETRLGKFCQLTRPLMANQHLFNENQIINIEALRKLIGETDTEERITTSLGPVRDCLSLLEAQMKDLHHNIIENHARRSKRWKYKLGFECLSCESRWEVTHDIRDLEQACLDPNRFLESSIVEPMAGCSCPIMLDFVESDVRLCVDDMVNDVIAEEQQ